MFVRSFSLRSKMILITVFTCSPFSFAFIYSFLPKMNQIKLNLYQIKNAAFGLWLTEKKATEARKLFENNNIEKLPTVRCFQKWYKDFNIGIFEFNDRVRRAACNDHEQR